MLSLLDVLACMLIYIYYANEIYNIIISQILSDHFSIK